MGVLDSISAKDSASPNFSLVIFSQAKNQLGEATLMTKMLMMMILEMLVMTILEQ